MQPLSILFISLLLLLSVPQAPNQRIIRTSYAQISTLSIAGGYFLYGILVDAAELGPTPDHKVSVVNVHDDADTILAAGSSVTAQQAPDDKESLDESGGVTGENEWQPPESVLQSQDEVTKRATDALVKGDDTSAAETEELKKAPEESANGELGHEKVAKVVNGVKRVDDNDPVALKEEEDHDHHEAETTKPENRPKDRPRQSAPAKRISLPTVEGTGYKPKSHLDLACMLRDIDNGEHVTDADTGVIMYNPFPICKETNRPLSFLFGVDSDNRLNCTFLVQDETYHLLQLYVHQDAPLSCRVPARLGSENMFAPVVFSVQGKLEQSHLDIATNFNFIFTYTDALINGKSSKKAGANITSAVAYPSYPSSTTRIIIGDELTFQFNVRWFPVARAPKQEDKSVASFAILCYCLASGVVAFAVAAFYFLVIVFPQRARARSAMRQAIAAGLAPDFSIFSTGYASTKR
ncbi:hypothetical protein V1515DRAFT_591084, partial [Lipomyces mesembrius]